MVTASYVSAEMQALDASAQDAGVLIINEVGLDPGIDHMSAMKMINEATQDGKGRVKRFSSLCGGLPAPEAAGSSPLGYKFSWSPKGVLLAARNSSRWREDGKIHEVQGSDLLAHASPLILNNAFSFDVLPNRDSTVFAELYQLAEAPTFFRGTLRYRGFCDRMLALSRVGLLEPGPVDHLRGVPSGISLRQWLAALVGASNPEQLEAVISKNLCDDVQKVGLEFMSWMGLLSEAPMPAGVRVDSPIDVTTALLNREEMSYTEGERDMVAMYHELDVERPDGSVERHTATLIQYAEPHGATAMARTVGLTAAICAQLVLDGPKNFGCGVQRPLTRTWYEPVLQCLEGEGIKMDERMHLVSAARQNTAAGAGGTTSTSSTAPMLLSKF